MTIFNGSTIEEAIEKGLEELGLTKEEAHIQVIQAPSKGFFGFRKRDGRVSIEPISDNVVTKADRSAIRGVPEEIVDQCDPVLSAKEETLELHNQIVKEASAEYSAYRARQDKSGNCGVMIKEAPTVTLKPDYERLLNLDEKTTISELAKYLNTITQKMGSPSLVKLKYQDDVYHFDLETNYQGRLIGKHGRILNSLQYLAQIFVHKVSRENISVFVNIGDYRNKRSEILERLGMSVALQAKIEGRSIYLDPMPSFERKIIHKALAEDPEINTYSEGREPYRYLVIEYIGRRF